MALKCRRIPKKECFNGKSSFHVKWAEIMFYSTVQWVH